MSMTLMEAPFLMANGKEADQEVINLLIRGDEIAGNRHALARESGIPRTTLDKLENGGMPRLDTYRKLRNYITKHDQPYLIGETSTEYGQTVEEEVVVMGEVSAGAITLAEERMQTFQNYQAMWSLSRFRKYTYGPVIFLKVSGSSMEPEIPDGSYIACAKHRGNIPDFTPVIARTDYEVTFKLFKESINTSGGKEVELIPLNRTFDNQRYLPEEIIIDYIVLGTINPWVHGFFQPNTPSHVIMRDSS